jgi:hypothetical protein
MAISKDSSKLLQKSLLILLIVLGITCFGSKLLLDSYFLGNRPREPRTEEGRTSSQFIKVNYGATVFLTQREHLLSESLMPMFLGFMLIGYLLNTRWKLFAPYKKDKWSRRISTKSSDKEKD